MNPQKKFTGKIDPAVLRFKRIRIRSFQDEVGNQRLNWNSTAPSKYSGFDHRCAILEIDRDIMFIPAQFVVPENPRSSGDRNSGNTILNSSDNRPPCTPSSCLRVSQTSTTPDQVCFAQLRFPGATIAVGVAGLSGATVAAGVTVVAGAMLAAGALSAPLLPLRLCVNPLVRRWRQIPSTTLRAVPLPALGRIYSAASRARPSIGARYAPV